MVPKKIGTHNEILRTRDPALLETCDVVVDVGAVYDASKFRFDHHQKTFQETMHSLRADFPWEIKLSSAGLIYFHYGEKILADLMKRPAEHRDTQTVYRKIYEEFIIEIDAIDNGVNMCDGDTRYRINTGLSSRVGGLNPKWNEEQTPAAADRQFQLAMKLAETEFLDKVNYYSNAWLPAKELVREAINKRYEVDKSGRIIELPQTGCPWKDHLFDIEEELGIQGELIYVIHTDTKSYRVQCVPLKLGAFDNRHSLPWRGLRDDELCRESGIPGCIFVHASGFIGGNQTRDGALEMARAALKTYSPDNVSEK